MIKILNFGGKVVNNYVLATKEGLIVIDTGYQNGFKRFSRKLSEFGFSFSDIAYIFITHIHDDHIGFLKALFDATKAPIILHSEGIERLKEGKNRFIGGCSTKLALLFCRAMALAGKGKHEFPPIDLSNRAIITNTNPEYLNSMGLPAKIMMLPGHTGDSIGLLLEGDKLFCGDAAMNNFPSTARQIIWIENLENYQQSWDVIINSGAKTIFPGHGNPFPVEDLILYRHFMDGKRLYPLN